MRSILERTNGVLYNAPLSNEHRCAHRCYGWCYPCSCRLKDVIATKLIESTYVHILDNRIEYNYPYSTCSIDWPYPCKWNYAIVDSVHVLHFDRNVFHDIHVAKCGSPYGSWFSSTWGFGEAIVLSSDNEMEEGDCEACACPCFRQIQVSHDQTDVPMHGCCTQQSMVLLPYLADAEKLIAMIHKIRHERMCEIHMIR